VHIKKHLNFTSLRQAVSDLVSGLSDRRQGGKVDHSLHDSCLSALAMMFFQDPSMLAFQTRLQSAMHKNNLQTLFDVNSIPKESQMKEILDAVSPESFHPIFKEFFARVQRAKYLEQFRFIDDAYLLPLDGTQYFSSERISCKHCLSKTLKNGKTIYYHQVLAATIVHPDLKQVIPLAPEPIQNGDGSEKQDCERNAGKRLVKKIRETHPKLKFIVLGDDLYANDPFIRMVKENNMSFIFTAKPDSHTFMFGSLDLLRYLGDGKTVVKQDEKGRKHIYKWCNNVPLNKTQSKSDYVNFLEFSIITDSKVTFKSSWVTDIPITADNIEKLAKAGRARWKIENEAFNTLKNQGYHAEHNFGHGSSNLSLNFFLLNLIAFFMHQIFELSDRYYKECRKKFSSKKEFWNQLRCTIRVLVFDNWEQLLQFVTDPPVNRAPPLQKSCNKKS